MALRSSASLAHLRSYIAGLDLAKLQRSRAYDTVMRLPTLVWFISFATVAATGLAKYEREVDPMLPDALYAVNIAMRLAAIFFFATLAGTVLVRMQPTAKARGFEPRVSALIGTFLIYVVVLFPRRELSLTEGFASTLLILIGNASAVYVLSQLGRSFSIMPEARQLVTSGLYRHLRHPLYSAEMISCLGVVLQYLSVWTALIFAIQIGFQLRRIRNEERVLIKIFPEYVAYMERSARLIPGIY